jgi:hypothetical protein
MIHSYLIGSLRRTFTLRRWNRNPFQMWMLVFLMSVSTNQIFYSDHGGAVSDLARQAQVMLAACNLVGGLIVFVGMHLREKAMAHWVELCGYIALTGSMGIYVWLVLAVSTPPTTSFGLGLSEAFVIASLHRATLIARRKAKVERRRPRREVSDVDDQDPPVPG